MKHLMVILLTVFFLQDTSAQFKKKEKVEIVWNLTRFDFGDVKAVRVETYHPLAIVAAPIAAISTITAIGCFISSATGDESTKGQMMVIGGASLLFSFPFWIATVDSEEWVIYSNGTSMRLEVKL